MRKQCYVIPPLSLQIRWAWKDETNRVSRNKCPTRNALSLMCRDKTAEHAGIEGPECSSAFTAPLGDRSASAASSGIIDGIIDASLNRYHNSRMPGDMFGKKLFSVKDECELIVARLS